MSAHADSGDRTAPAPLVPPHWRLPLLAVVLLWVWVLFLFRDTAAGMVAIWSRSDTFAHGFFVPPIALWLIWRQRSRLWPLQPRPLPWMLLPMALAALLWLLGDMVAANAPSQLALVALLALAVPCLLGLQVTKAVLFPLGFLFFAVPIGEFMLEPLMEGTASFTVLALRATGIPVYRDGLQFVIPSGAWSVVEACSGVRYLIASLTVGTLYAHLSYRSAKRRWLFIGVAIVVPIIANWLRAYMIVLIGHLSSNRLGVGVDHLLYGWVFFGVVILTMFWIGSRWADADVPVAPAANVGRAGVVPAPMTPILATVLSAALLVFVPPWYSVRLESQGKVAGPALSAPERLSPAWSRSTQAPSDWRPAFQRPAASMQAGYTDGSAEVGLYVGYYRNQHAGSKLVSSSNTFTVDPQSGWSRVYAGTRPLQMQQPRLDVRVAELRDSPVPGRPDEQRLVVWQWYWIGGWWTSDDRLAKAYGALQRTLGRGDDSAVVVVYALQQKGAEAALRAFVRANLAPLQDFLQGARGR